MATDPITAFGLVASIGMKMFGMASSGPDPSEVAIFETYRLVQSVAEQINAQGGSLVGIHDQIIALRAELGEVLVFHDDQRDTAALLNALRRIEEHYEAYLLETIDASSTPARAAIEYAEHLAAEEMRFRELLMQVASNAPLGLDVALDGVVFELYLNRRDGDGEFSPAYRARERIAEIRDTMERELLPLVESARVSLENERRAAAGLMSVSDWSSADEAVVFGASHHAPWLNRVVLTCLRFTAKPFDGSIGDFVNLAPDPRGPASVILHGDLGAMPSEICGSRLTHDKGLHIDGVAIRALESPATSARSL